MGIISFSGRKRSGKDTAGIIAQTLLSFPKADNATVLKYLISPMDNPEWVIKKWAGKLKEITTILTGISDLEHEENKRKVIFSFYRITNGFTGKVYDKEDHEEALSLYKSLKTTYLKKHSNDEVAENITIVEYNITPRFVLQYLGTEIGRGLYSELWIKSLLRDYKPKGYYRYEGKDQAHIEILNGDTYFKNFHTDTKENIIDYLKKNIKFTDFTSEEERDSLINTWFDTYTVEAGSKWIITDTRFPNEAKAVLSLNGINIRIIREATEIVDFHESETALDNYTNFNYVINNDGSIESLIECVRTILKKEKLI